MKPSRREVMAGAGAFGIVAFAGAGAVTFLRAPGFDRAEIRDLLALLPDRQAAAGIGAAWLGRHSAYARSWSVLPELVAKRLVQSGWQGSNIDALRALVAGIVRADFDVGAIEDVEGWRISRFQAQLCGLACLDASRPRPA
jgi:hypothetical protein